MKTTKIILGLSVLFLVFSCSKNETADTNSFTKDEALLNAKIDVANDDVSDIVEGQFNATMENNATGKSLESETSAPNLPSCITITRVPAFGTAITPGTLVTKTIDFGTTGCAMPNGAVLKGKIIASFTFSPNAVSHTINYELLDFYHNLTKFNGNKTFTRTMSVATSSIPSHPVVVMNVDLTATFANGSVLNRVGTRTREIVAGFDTPLLFNDNVYQVTGNWTTTYPNTTIQTSTITTPLLVKMSCIAVNKPLLVQGVITFVRNNNTATLDYGTGDCDNSAVFTINGVATTITIGN